MNIIFSLIQYLVFAFLLYIVLDCIACFTINEKIRKNFELFYSLGETNTDFSDFVSNIFKSLSLKDKALFLRIKKPTDKDKFYRLQVRIGLAWNTLFQSWSKDYFYSNIEKNLTVFGLTLNDITKI